MEPKHKNIIKRQAKKTKKSEAAVVRIAIENIEA